MKQKASLSKSNQGHKGCKKKELSLEIIGENSQYLHSKIILILLFALLVLLSIRQVSSPDVGFHLKAGEYILSGEGWPANDPFTFTVRDHPYIDTSWGYQIVLASIQKIAGAPGIILFNTLLVLLIFGIVCRTMRLAPSESTSLLVLLFLGILASEMRFETRPELVSYLFLALVLLILNRHAEGKRSPLWALAVIHLIWANVHGLFVLGWIAQGCFFLGLLLRDRRIDYRLLSWAAASFAVTFINPYGWRGALFSLTLATRLQPENIFAQSIGEFTSPFALGLSEQYPFFPRLPIYAFRVFSVLSFLALIPAWKKKRYGHVFLWIAFFFLSFRMIRNMPLPVIACLPMAVWGLSISSFLEGIKVRKKLIPALLKVAAIAVGIAVIVLCLRVYHDAYYITNRRVDRFGLKWNHYPLPIDAADYAHRVQLNGPVLNHLNFGGWLIWTLSDPVFIDGRLEVMGEEFYTYYRNILASPEGLRSCVARYGIRWIIFPYAFNPKFLGQLIQNENWELVYVDHLAAIFVRKNYIKEISLLPKIPSPIVDELTFHALPGLEDTSHLQFEGTSRPESRDTSPLNIGDTSRPGKIQHWLSGLIRQEKFPYEDHYLGLFHLYRGELNQAEARFKRAIAESRGAYYEIYNNLGAVLFRMKRYDEARRCYEIVLEEAPNNRIANERLQSISHLPTK